MMQEYRRPRGVSLVETLLATAIFMCAFVAFLDVWPVQARAVVLGREVLAASACAERQMEATVAAGYAAATNRAGTDVVSHSVNGVTTMTTFTWSVTVTTQSDTNKNIVVQVHWTEGQVMRSVDMQTLLANPS